MLKKNFHDYCLIILIASLSFGVIGGGAQITRLLSLCFIPVNFIYIIKRKIPSIIGLLLIGGLIWLSFAIISLGWTEDLVNGKYNITYLFIYFNLVITLYIQGKGALNPLGSILSGWCLFFFITIPIALSEIITGSHLYTNSIQTNMTNTGEAINGIVGKKYAAVTYNNYNEYMTALSFGFPYFFSSVIYNNSNVQVNNKKYNIIFWLFIFGIACIVFITASRGAILCFILCSVILFRFLGKMNFPYKKTILRLVTVFAFLSIILFSQTLFNQLTSRMEATDLSEDMGRMLIYAEAFRLIQESDYWGLGPYGFEHIWGFAPHNLWLEIFTQYGWIVTLIVVIVSIELLRISIKKARNDMTFKCLFYMVFLTLPIITVINSGYLNFSFTWLSLGSLIVIVQKNDTEKNSLLLVRKK